jgi:hypothetical protein
VARLVGADPRLTIENADLEAVVAKRKLARSGEADDAGADDDHVALARRLCGALHRARS